MFELEINHQTINRILQKYNYKSFKYQTPSPYTQMFMNVSCNISYALFNQKNISYWSQENQNWRRDLQLAFGFSVWIIGPIIFEGPLTGARYLGILQNKINVRLT